MKFIQRKKDITSCALHVMAMVFMLCDHLWATLFPGQEWMSCVGRLAFPLFAFMTVEGYVHTANIKRYLQRLFVFALLSEIPFDLMYGSSIFYPFHQNVLWTFFLAVFFLCVIDKANALKYRWMTWCVWGLVALVGFLLGTIFMVDYYGVGILTVFVFYFFRKRMWWCFLGQLLCLAFLNIHVLGGFYYVITVAGYKIEIVQQGLALLALIPIWLYRGRQGYHSKVFQYFCYAFYPMHMLLLYLVWQSIG